MSKIRKDLKALRQGKLAKTNIDDTKSKPDKIKTAVFLISFTGILLVMLGYGYKLGLANSFGYYAVDIVDDATDFLYAASTPISIIFNRFGDSEFFSSLFQEKFFLYPLIILSAVFLSYFLFVRYCLCRSDMRDMVVEWLEESAKASFWDEVIYTDNVLKGFLKVFGLVMASTFYIVVSFYGILILALMFLIVVPAWGYAEGKAVAEDFIINSDRCFRHYVDGPRPEEAKGKREKVAICVSVDNGQGIVTGRQIARNSQRIFLYVKDYRINDKGQKEAIRIPKSYPIRNAVIERVDTEDMPDN